MKTIYVIDASGVLLTKSEVREIRDSILSSEREEEVKQAN